MYPLKRLIQLPFLLLFFMIGCGEDPYTKGLELYNQGNYDASIKLFSTIEDERKNEPEFQETFALAYMHKGQLLYKKTRNVKSFSGNYEKAKEIMPLKSSDHFKKEHSEILFSLANAFLSAKEKNSREKDKFYSDAVNHLLTSIALDSTNEKSIQLMAQLEETDFKKMLDKAEKLYADANRTGDVDLFFSSELYLKKARLFKPEDSKVKNLNSRLRRKLLGVLDYRDGISIAVTNSLRKNELLTLKIAVKNYLGTSQLIDPYQFHLINSSGEDYQPDEKEMGLVGFLGQKSLSAVTLDQGNSYIEGVLVFKIPENTSAKYITYMYEDKELIRKYFY